MSLLNQKKKSSGFTLVELIVVIVVLATLATLAAPSLQDFTRNNRITAQANELSSTISYARSAATTNPVGITLTLTAQTPGWSMTVTDLSCPSGGDCVLREDDFTNTSLNVLPLVLDFNTRGVLENGAQILTLQHTPCSGARQSIELEILISGAVRKRLQDCQ